MRWLILIPLLLTGCAENPIRQKGAAVMDVMLQEAEMIICNDASVGSVRRRYGSSEALSRKWESFCETVNVPIVGGEHE